MLPLRTAGPAILDSQDRPVHLRGVNLGGWMNLENFVNGYPGSEHGLRAAMSAGLGPDRAEHFFETMADAFFTPADAARLVAAGATVIRLPLNYRHFERDDDPGVYRPAAFARLDAALAACEAAGLYAILDLHAAPGWQSPDWHCDNANRHALFWTHRHFQDRFVALWEQLARRYVGRAVVAGYNLLNEPVTGAERGRHLTGNITDWRAINALYRRTTAAIRAIDPDHIIIIEGDQYSTRFTGLDAPFAPNLVYSSHFYHDAGFHAAPYPGTIQNRDWTAATIAADFSATEALAFTQKHRVPLYVGELGSIYHQPDAGRDQALLDTVAALQSAGAHWTVWTYKDLGLMGWSHVAPDAEIHRVLAPCERAKRALGLDYIDALRPRPAAWQTIYDHVVPALRAELPASYADVNLGEHHCLAAFTVTLAEALQPLFVDCWREKTEADVERILAAYRCENCQVPPARATLFRL